ncbi:glycosyltransferase [Costertonia aggregata]|uniref:Glycosyltransferase n=1 Tax=Costertonia aggregata TaxID=343403 RepID=A0A7H9AP66_9FLAO|nr:glycosyltransferase [Costertonia aggregata]QLG45238.1 glycosyltransferase [Costertonia aggregata]
MNFSVLMSVYEKDNPTYLKEALDSIWIQQSLKPTQIVIVEDGPLPDKLFAIIKEFSKTAPVERVKLATNVGLGKALSKGIEYCSYELVARMDSDDISKPERFERQIAFLKKHKEIDVLGTFIDEFKETTSNIIATRKVPEKNLEIKSKLKVRNTMNHVSIMAKKNKILISGNYKTMFYFEDYYLWARMFMNDCIFYNIQESLVNVRIGQDMIGRRLGLSYAKHEINFYRKLKDIGFIGNLAFLKAIFLRLPLRFLPKKILGVFYNYIIRS